MPTVLIQAVGGGYHDEACDVCRISGSSKRRTFRLAIERVDKFDDEYPDRAPLAAAAAYSGGGGAFEPSAGGRMRFGA